MIMMIMIRIEELQQQETIVALRFVSRVVSGFLLFERGCIEEAEIFPCILYASWKMFCNRFLTPSSFTCSLLLLRVQLSVGGGGVGRGRGCCWSMMDWVVCGVWLQVVFVEFDVSSSGSSSCMFFDFWQMTFWLSDCLCIWLWGLWPLIEVWYYSRGY